jgi:glycosyltransferase involved in cell wall biosynthesis
VDHAKLMSEPIHPNPTPDLSVILPSLKADAEYLRCIYALRAVLAGKSHYEIISVVRDLETFVDLESSDLRIVPEESPGIYAAMNTGLDHANGTYVYFIGQDDILLPEAIDALNRGMQKDADLILANVFYGKGRVYKNRPSPRWLIWRNWCHQGIIYRRELLRETGTHFPEAFKTQADHYVNIILTAGHRATIVKHNGCIAWYSASGYSCKIVDAAFRVRFRSLIREYFGFPSFVTVVFRFSLMNLVRRVFHR